MMSNLLSSCVLVLCFSDSSDIELRMEQAKKEILSTKQVETKKVETKKVETVKQDTPRIILQSPIVINKQSRTILPKVMVQPVRRTFRNNEGC